MKKLIAISVVFALVAGVAFAVDLGGTVIGKVDVLNASSGAGSAVKAGGAFGRIRIEGGGEVADGKFGGWLRFDPLGGNSLNGLIAGIAWWKPIDQLKVGFGGNGGDGIWGQEGNSGWGFTPFGVTDSGVVYTGDHVWGGGTRGTQIQTRHAFYSGFGDNRLYIEITPVDMLSINIGIPFFRYGQEPWAAPKLGKIEDIFKAVDAQVAVNLSFGSFAFTYRGNNPDGGGDSDIKKSEVFGFFSLTAIENLQIDFGLGADFSSDTPIALGLAASYGRDTWGIRFRSTFAIPIRGEQKFGFLFDVLPYFVINESFSVYVNTGIRVARIDDLEHESDWHVNPYIVVGEGWGPKFVAGIDVFASLSSGGVNFKLPVGILVSF